MYGLVNRTIQRCIVAEFGHEAWGRVARRTGWSGEEFVTLQAYDDSISYALVRAAAEELRLAQDEILESIGSYLVTHTVKEVYGELLDMFGTSFAEFLGNLDNMYARISLSDPDLKPPSFTVETIAEGHLIAVYRSHRPGLAALAKGAIHALATRFGVVVDVTCEESYENEAGHYCHFTILERTEEGRLSA